MASGDNSGLGTIRMEQFLRAVKDDLEVEDYSPILILGKCGIGKTESIHDLAEELGIGFLSLRLQQYEITDLVGLPYTKVDEYGDMITSHAQADLLPNPKLTTPGILLLDEITSCSADMRAAVYQLTDKERSLGKYKLPPRWKIICAGNGADDGGVYRGIERALISRGKRWRIEPNLEAWKAWAQARGIHATILAFLTFQPDKLYVDPADDDDVTPATTPRDYEKLSTVLTNLEKKRNKSCLDEEDVHIYATGTLDRRTAASFETFYQYKRAMPSPLDIMNGKTDAESMRNQKEEVMYIVAESIVALMKKELEENCVKEHGMFKPNERAFEVTCNVVNWCVDMCEYNVRADVGILVIKDLCASIGPIIGDIMVDDRFDDKCPRFTEFLMKNSIVVKQL